MTDFIEQKIKNHNYNKDKDKGISERILSKIINPIIFIIVGLMNIIFANKLTKILPTISGIMLIATSIISLVHNIMKKEYKTLDTMKIPENVVSIILGISIVLKRDNAISFIAIVWGISGLRKGTKELNIAIYNKVHKDKFILELLHAIFELVISILLIYNPFEKIEEHLILLGIEMIISSTKYMFNDKKYKDIEDWYIIKIYK